MRFKKGVLKTINKIDLDDPNKLNEFKEKGVCILAHTCDHNFSFSIFLKNTGQLYLHRQPPDVIRSGKINLWKIENKTVPKGSVLLTIRYSDYSTSEQYYNIFLKDENDFKKIIESVKGYFENISLN